MVRKLTWLNEFQMYIKIYLLQRSAWQLILEKNCLDLQIQKHPLCWVLKFSKKLKPAWIIQTQYFFIDYKVYSHRQCSSTGDAMQLNLHGLNTVREMLLILLRRIIRLCIITQFDVTVQLLFFFFFFKLDETDDGKLLVHAVRFHILLVLDFPTWCTINSQKEVKHLTITFKSYLLKLVSLKMKKTKNYT